MTGRIYSQVIDFFRLTPASRLAERIGDVARGLARTADFLLYRVLFAPFRAVGAWLDEANPFHAGPDAQKAREREMAQQSQGEPHAEAWPAEDRYAYVSDYGDDIGGERGFSFADRPVTDAPQQPAARPGSANLAFARLRSGVAGAAQRVGDARRRLIEYSSDAAARSRAACRRGAGGAAAYLGEKISNPGRTAGEIGSAARDAAVAAHRRVRQLNRIDATVACLFAVALLGPLVSPGLSDETTVALTRHNPLVDRVGVAAERGLSLVKPSAPTLWSGYQQASAERDIAPDWVLNAGVDLGPLTPAEALNREARVIELRPAPLWSPALAALSVEDKISDYETLETANIPVGAEAFGPSEPLEEQEVAALELGAFDTGPTAPVAVAATRPAPGDNGLSSGDYATASVGPAGADAAWPAAETADEQGDLPSSLAEALSLGAQDVPPKFAPRPSMRPVLIGAKRTPRLTVVLTAVGLNEAASRAAIERLPSAVAIAVAPVASDPAAWVDAAKATGRAALLEIPMEPVTYPRVNPGPLTLLAGDDAKENLARLKQALDKAPEVDGVASYLGGRFSSVRGAVQPVMAELKKRNLFVLETDPTPLSHLLRTAAEIDMPAASSFVSLDKSGRSSDLAEGFARLEEAAKVKGHAIGVAVAVPKSVEAIEAWARQLEKRGFRLTALAM